MISVLCVHSETPLCEQAKQILEETKEFTVDTAGSAEEALEKIKATSYDAIVSDYKLNGIDGLAFLKGLRSSDIKTPFIICIDNELKEVIISAFENGADFYIGKDGKWTFIVTNLPLKSGPQSDTTNLKTPYPFRREIPCVHRAFTGRYLCSRQDRPIPRREPGRLQDARLQL